MSCPANTSYAKSDEGGGLEFFSKIQMHCEVCGATEGGDLDAREGYVEFDITWGPNTFDGAIAELSVGILGYAVFAVNECGERTGLALATVNALGVLDGAEPCCDLYKYWVTVRSILPQGQTYQTFMVVPLTSIGALDVGWTATVNDYYPTVGGPVPAGVMGATVGAPVGPRPAPAPPPAVAPAAPGAPSAPAPSAPSGTRAPPSVTRDVLQQVSTTTQKKAQADHANGLKAMTTLFALAVSRACLLH
jgi:hypothetical protein